MSGGANFDRSGSRRSACGGRSRVWFVACANAAAVLVIAICVLWPLGLTRAQGDIESLLAGIVKIVATGAAKKTGTGFVVARTKGDTYIVTAAHVVEGADRVSVYFYGRQSTAVAGTASKIEAGESRGLALVTVSSAAPSDVVALPLGTDIKVSRGEPVKGVGHQPSHGDWGVISGDVASREGSVIRIQAPVEQQTSGGPVIRNGRGVGMFVSQQPNIGIAITALAVQNYLDGALPPGVVTSEKPPKSETTEKPPTPEKPPAADTRQKKIDPYKLDIHPIPSLEGPV